jgi:hypothetical protein
MFVGAEADVALRLGTARRWVTRPLFVLSTPLTFFVVEILCVWER